MSNPKNTTIVLVPGAWHSPDCYDTIIPALHDAGYKIRKAKFRSVLEEGQAPVSTRQQDIDSIRQQITEATSEGQRVVLVMHSYGGMPGSEAVEGFTQAALAQQGHSDGRGVVHLVYLTALVLRKGESITDLIPQAGAAPWTKTNADGTVSEVTDARYAFYEDLPDDVVADCIAKLRPWCFLVSRGPLAYAPWTEVPATYLITTKDKAILPSLQVMMVQNIRDAGALRVREVALETAHSPFLTMPKETSDVILTAAAGGQ